VPVGWGAVAEQRGRHAVQVQGVGADPGQGAAAKQVELVGQGEGVREGGGQGWGELGGVFGEQGQRHRLGRQPRQQRHQSQGGGVVGGELVEDHRPGRGQRHRIPPSPLTTLEHLRRPLLHQVQIRHRGHRRVGQEARGLIDRQGQIPQHVRDLIRLPFGETGDAGTQQADRFPAGELGDLDLFGLGHAGPVRVPGGDHHMSRSARQERGECGGVFGVVEDQQPPVPTPQRPPQPGDSDPCRILRVGEMQRSGEVG
jgi:hypothetical protein